MVRLMLGVPVGKLSMSSFWVQLIKYNQKARLPLYTMVSNRVDLNRSYLVEEAIKGGYDLLMIDSDVIINSEIADIKKYLDEDFKDNKVGMVVAPTIGASGILLANSPDNKKSETWVTKHAGLGFACIRKEVLNKLPVISEYHALGSIVQMRIVYATNTSEDIMLSQRITELGYKILVDSRIKVLHIQPEYLSFPENWNGNAL